VPAYEAAGILNLDFQDKTFILTTPDVSDLLSDLGRKQAMIMIKDQTKYYEDNPSIAAKHFAKLPFQWPVIKER